jgi:hypothetical protein
VCADPVETPPQRADVDPGKILLDKLLTAVAYNSWARGRPAAVSEATACFATGRPAVCADPAEILRQKADADPGQILTRQAADSCDLQ